GEEKGEDGGTTAAGAATTTDRGDQGEIGELGELAHDRERPGTALGFDRCGCRRLTKGVGHVGANVRRGGARRRTPGARGKVWSQGAPAKPPRTDRGPLRGPPVPLPRPQSSLLSPSPGRKRPAPAR